MFETAIRELPHQRLWLEYRMKPHAFARLKAGEGVHDQLKGHPAIAQDLSYV
jgi:hypothetical protein